jgi:inner membrane protein
MEPVTHLLTGACIGRVGLNRRTAYATLASTLAAEAPDIDILWSLHGPVTGLAHHRGITHTLVATPVMALLVTGVVWLIDWAYEHSRKPNLGAQPVRWGWVYFSAFLAHLSHLALDWTNNYGVRPFFPFDAHWYSGDLVFIAEPVLWGFLLLALILPALFGLADREIGARRTRFRPRGWAITALLAMTLLWCWRWAEHAQGRNLVEAANVTNTPIQRISLEPYPVDPFRWHAIIETNETYQVAEVNTRTGQVVSDPHVDSLFKPQRTVATDTARRTRLGQVYLDWSQWPVVREIGPQPVALNSGPPITPDRPWTTVELSDLRFAYAYLDTSMVGRSDQSLDHMLTYSGLSGWVYVVNGQEAIGQFLGGREQRPPYKWHWPFRLK